MKTVKRKDKFPSWANYIAKDGNGEKWFYESMPGFIDWPSSTWATRGKCEFYKHSKEPNNPEKKIWKIVD